MDTNKLNLYKFGPKTLDIYNYDSFSPVIIASSEDKAWEIYRNYKYYIEDNDIVILLNIPISELKEQIII